MGWLRRRSPEHRFFFVHLQKTAGISLLWRLRRVFPDVAIYPNASDGDIWADQPQMSVTTLQSRWADPRRRAEIRLIAGHFPLATAELLGGGFTTFTVLRDPVSRTLSFLRHYRAAHPDLAGRSLVEIYEDPFVFSGIVHNHMTKMLGLTPAEMTAGAVTAVDLGETHLRRAQDNLLAMGLVGLTDQLEAFCGRLSERFGWELGEPIRSNESAPIAVPPAFEARIAEDNALDLQLYEFARERWQVTAPATGS